MDLNYTTFTDKPAEGATAALQNLVRESRTLELEIEEMIKQTKIKEEKLRDLLWRLIPDEMKRLGLEKLTTPDGLEVESKREVNANISKERESTAFAWLNANGHGSLIKREIKISFNRDQEIEARKLLETLQADYPAATENQTVHNSTLKAWVKEMLNKGVAIPQETFGVFDRQVAKIKQAKK
jgi:hypothetical protein